MANEFDYENFTSKAPILSNFMQQAGDYAPAAGAAGAAGAGGLMASVAPFLGPVGLGLQGLGLASSLYGSYKQGQQARRQHRLAVQQFQAEMDRQRREEDRQGRLDQRQGRLDEQDLAHQKYGEALQGGQYSQGLEDRELDRYGTYARNIGL